MAKNINKHNINLVSVLENLQKTTEKGIFFIEGKEKDTFLSFANLYKNAKRRLYALQRSGIKPHDELIFQIEHNQVFIELFWACLLGGIIPVPIHLAYKEFIFEKLIGIWDQLNNPHIIISDSHFQTIISKREFSAKTWISEKTLFLEGLENNELEGEILYPSPDDIAFIQFSSGSTGSPKGVMLTHRNLIANISAISKAAGYAGEDKMINWMPLTHDMGLIGFHINPLFEGMTHFIMPTNLFVRKPNLWFDKVSENRINILGSPNFGYHYLLKHCSSRTYDWDLSSVKVFYNGAEPISMELIQAFTQEFTQYGLKANAICPVYGLAEASLAVSITHIKEEPSFVKLNRDKLGIRAHVEFVEEGQTGISVVNVGTPINDCRVHIADRKGNLLEENQIGDIYISGANVTSGYYNNQAETQRVKKEGAWIKTGDLGFVKDKCLYVTGRSKDIIFINGQNFYPHDIEEVASLLEDIELNKVAVVGCFNESLQRDEIIAFLYHKGKIQTFIPRISPLKNHLNRKIGINLDKVLPISKIPKTTSGKLQRYKLEEQYKAGDFREIHQAIKESLEIAKPEAFVKHAGEDLSKLEGSILEIWKRVLGIEDIGIGQNFNEVGGNSLKAGEISLLIRKELQIDLPLEKFYENPSIKTLAESLSSFSKLTYSPIRVGESLDTNRYSLSPTQQGVYFQWEVNKASTGYNMPMACKIEGPLDVEKLVDCIEQLILRHDSLRMSFQKDEEAQPYFYIQANVAVDIPVIGCKPEEVQGKLRSLVKPFDLHGGPLFRFAVLEVEAPIRILFLDFHHIISDGVSAFNFIEELFKLYEGVEIPNLPVGYADYVLWEKEYLLSDPVKEHAKYWSTYLKGDLPKLELSTDHPRPPIFSYEGGRIEFHFDHKETEELKALTNTYACTLAELLFSIYSILLAKYTGQDACIIGIPTAGRKHPDILKSQGMFVNNLAIKASTDLYSTFERILDQNKQQIRAGLAHQDYPFYHLIDQKNSSRDASRNPIFDTMFVYQNMGFPNSPSKEISLSRYFFDPGFSKYDLSLEIFEEQNSLKYAFEYSSHLFERETIIRLSRHFTTLISNIHKQPKAPLKSITLLSPDEYRENVLQFNDTQRAWTQKQTILERFTEQVEKGPENTALEFGGQLLTYQQLDKKSSQLASYLIGKGIGTHDVVSIWLPRSQELIVSLMAVLKTGACYLPLDVSTPEERAKFMIEDSDSRVLITESSKKSLGLGIGNKGLEVLYVDKGAWELKEAYELPKVGLGDLAYIIYTSGSTGLPKGVMIEHRALINYISWAADTYVRGERVHFPLFTSISFDLTITSIFTPLITGNKIVIYPEEENPQVIQNVILEGKVEVIKLTPSHLRLIKEIPQEKLKNAHRVKRLIVGGEILPTVLAEELCSLFNQDIEIFNEYGPTEATVGCMIHQYQPQELSRSVPIGIPIQNTQVYLLDSFLEPVPVGVEGEIFISGEGLARGYIANEKSSAQKFVDNPFIENQRMYKTGDMARWLPSGILEFIGRRDQQLKIQGHRVEVSEVERTLLAYPVINEAIVSSQENKNSEVYLKAFYKRNENWQEAFDESSLREFLAKRLPYYMIPAYFIEVEEFPLTQNGKIDYRSLSHLEETNAEVIEPQSYIEQVSVGVWEEVLGKKNIRLQDNFYALGGDSIKAVQIAAKLHEHGISVQVKDILTYHTIAHISRHSVEIEEYQVYKQGEHVGDFAPWPIISWFFSQNFSNPHYYNQTLLFKLHAGVDIALLNHSFSLLLKHHDGLRINYASDTHTLFYNSHYVQAEFKLSEFEIEKDAELPELLYSLGDSFHLENKLLFRGAIIRNQNTFYRLFISAHHLLVDGISWRILLEDLLAIYKSLTGGTEVRLPSKTASLKEWSNEIFQYAQQEEIEDELEYWQQVESSEFVLPLETPSTNWAVANRRSITGELDKKTTQFLLKELPITYKIDILTLQVAALVLTFKSWVDSSEFVIEMENHGRNLEGIDVSRTVGWFTAMFPLKISWNDDDLGNLIKRVKQELNTVPKHGLSYGIHKYIKRAFGTTQKRPTALRFNYLGAFDEALNNELLSFEKRYSGRDSDSKNVLTAKLEWNSLVVDGELQVEIWFNHEAFRESTIQKMLDSFLHNIERLLSYIQNESMVLLTPSDFSASELSQEELDLLFE